jgi:hypothetical protein
MIKIVNGLMLYERIIKYFQIILIAIVITLLGFTILKVDIDLSFSLLSAALFTFLIIITFDKVFIKNPLSVCLLLYSFLFVVLPLLYIVYSGNEYKYGKSFMVDGVNLNETNLYGLIALMVFYIASWYGLRVKKIPIALESEKIKWKYLIVFILIILFYSLLRKLDFELAKSDGNFPSESIISYILYDNALVLVIAAYFFYYINTYIHSKKIIYLYFIIFVYYITVLTVFGSKASVMVIYIEMILFPIALSLEFKNTKVISIETGALIALLLSSFLIFYFVNEIRLSNIEFEVLDSLNKLLEFNTFFENLNRILQRLAWGSIDQYFVIFSMVFDNKYLLDDKNKFILYIFKSTQNLVLPGTPFIEAIAPSSEILGLLLNGDNISNLVDDKNSLYAIYNSQPYSLYGFFLLIFGFFSPLFIYLYMRLISSIYFMTNNIYIKIVFLLFFNESLVCFGIDTVINNTMHTFISVGVIYFSCKYMSKLK